MTAEERLKKIESYGNAHTKLLEALQQFPQEMWLFKPAPDDWSIHEIVVHITDSGEVNSYVRCRRFIAEPVWATTVYHPENGAMSMDDWLNVYERHVPEHIEQMQDCYQAWLEDR